MLAIGDTVTIELTQADVDHAETSREYHRRYDSDVSSNCYCPIAKALLRNGYRLPSVNSETFVVFWEDLDHLHVACYHGAVDAAGSYAMGDFDNEETVRLGVIRINIQAVNV